MKKIYIKNRKRAIILVTMTVIMFIFVLINSSFGMKHYYNTGFVTGIVTATKLNVRSGPGTIYSVVDTVNKNEYVRVFAGIGNWYIIQTDDDHVGMVSSQYIKAIYSTESEKTSSNNTSTQTTTVLTEDEKEVFNLINNKRIGAGLSALKIDDEVQNIARIKAKDLVDNNYFSHNSPTYGTPFQMLKSFGVSYKSAGENIAGNSSNSGAVEAWMNSEGHRANILNNSYNYTGVAVVKSNKYGKIFVQMFIGR